MLNNRLFRRTARFFNRGGFTLVELLVFIGIIAILAGVALGPITNGIKKAKQSSGLQSAHALGLAMYSAANDNSQAYPDTSGGNAGNIASALLAGGYVTDATIFSLSGDANATFAKVSSSTNTATTITNNQVSWDFIGGGVSSTQYTFLPVLWSTLTGGTPPASFAVTAGQPIVGTPASTGKNPFGTDGIAVFYVNNAAAFVNSTVSGSTLSVNMVSGTNNLGGAPAYAVRAGI